MTDHKDAQQATVIFETLPHDQNTEDNAYIVEKKHFSLHLFWHFKKRCGVRAEWTTAAGSPSKKNKKLTSQTEERRDFWQIPASFIGTYEGENKGEAVASKWATLLQSQQMCENTHMRPAITRHDT